MKKKVSIALSGGGARGMAHVGVIEELETQGYEIVSLAGTSMGALVAGVYALEKLEDFKNWLYSLDKLKVFSLVDFTLSKQGLIRGDKVFNSLREFIPDKMIEDLEIPFCAVAADILNQEEVVFTTGSIFEAIRASTAIPTVLTPVKTKNGLLVDGGVMNNIPIEHLKRRPGDILVAVDVNAMVPVEHPKISKQEIEKQQSIYRRRMQDFQKQLLKLSSKDDENDLGYFDLINRTISLMTHHMTQNILDQYQPDMLIQVSHDSIGMYDFYKAEEMVEMGRHAAGKCIKHYETRLRTGIKE